MAERLTKPGKVICTSGIVFLYLLTGVLCLRRGMSTWDFIALLRLGMLAILPSAAGLLPTSPAKLFFLLPVLLLEGTLSPYLLWNLPAMLLFLTADLLLLYPGREHRPAVCLSVLPAAAGVLLYDVLCMAGLGVYYTFFRTYGGTPVTKGLALFLFTAVITGLLYWLFAGIVRRIPGLAGLAETFRGLENWIPAIFCSALLFLAIAENIYIPEDQLLYRTDGTLYGIAAEISTSSIPYFRSLRFFWGILQIFVLLLHGLYLLLLARAVSLRQKMQSSEEKHAALSRFTAGLEENLTDMRGVRHDMKNLLLTMGIFVSRSGDPEMQKFWQEKIHPCLEDTVRRSSLLDSLHGVQDEGLKSFLYYKLTQAEEMGVQTAADIRLEDKPFEATGDLIRLLGIFLDNAMEETLLTGGELLFSMIRLETGIRIRISNPVRAETAARGIHAGMSDKGTGRGSGLLSARNIVDRYDRLVWNSHFADGRFVQTLFLEE